VQCLGDVTLIEGRALIAKLLQEEIRIGEEPVGHLLPTREIGRREIHLDALAGERRLLRPEMFLGDPIEPLLGIGAAV